LKVTRKPGAAGTALRAAVKTLDGVQGRVGWFPSAKYEDGTPVALAALVNEYGSAKRKIPPRSFMRSTQAEKKAEWKEITHRLSAAVFQGKLKAGALMEGLTQAAEGAIRQTISKITQPALAARTIAARRSRNAKGNASDKPLVDTGLMIASLTSQVTKK
jgi:hypothetical protein